MFLLRPLHICTFASALFLVAQLSLHAFETNGDVDLSFDAGKITGATVTSCIVQPDGKVVVFGDFTRANEMPRITFVRFNTDGTVDSSFSTSEGYYTYAAGPPYGADLLLQPDNKFLVVAVAESDDRGVGIARLNSDGSPDEAFDPGRVISNDGESDGNGMATHPGMVFAVQLQSDGKVVVLGEFSYVVTGTGTSVPRSGIARFNADGTFDSSFDPGTGLHFVAAYSTAKYLMVKQSTGKIIVAGPFDMFDGHPIPGIVRLNTDGSFDGSFVPGSATDFSKVDGFSTQNDDKIFVFGKPASFDGKYHHGLVRLMPDGTVDTGFNTEAFKDYANPAEITQAVQQVDGKIVTVGFFHSLGSATAHSIVRLQSNGDRDTSFNSDDATGACGQVSTLVIRGSDHELFVGGYFSTYNGVLRNNIALIKPDGTLDAAFAPITGLTDGSVRIRAIAAQSDGKILAGGSFSSVNGKPHRGFVRLNRDGSVDTSFGVTKGTSGPVRAIVQQPDHKILIAGNFSAVDGVARGRIARLNADGTLDNDFDPGIGPDATIMALALDLAGNVYIGGSFANVDAVSRGGMAKLSASGTLVTSFDPGSALQFDAGTSVFPGYVTAIAPPTANNGPVFAGTFNRYNGATVKDVIRVDAATAAIDSAFGDPSRQSILFGPIDDMKLTADGKYVIAGQLASDIKLARLNSDGSVDSSFASQTECTVGSRPQLALQGTKIFFSGIRHGIGCSGSGHFTVSRVLTNGSIDNTFNSGVGASKMDDLGWLYCLAVDPNGRPLVGGQFDMYNGYRRYSIVRLSDQRYKISGLTRLENLHISLQGMGPPNSQLSILASPNLSPNSFVPLTTLSTNSQGIFSYDDADAMGMSPRFYELSIP